MAAQRGLFGGQAPTTAAAAGNAFLHFGRLEPGYPPIDQMKLQKLIYYAHSWHLAHFDQPLFDEDIEAWPWGPVVRDIYTQTVEYGRQPVTRNLVELRRTDRLKFTFVTPRVDNDDTLSFLRSVWETHRSYTGVQLSNSTHAKGEPWAIIKEKYGSLENKPRIPNELIRAVFKAKLERLADHDSAA